MNMTAPMIDELEQEAGATRRVLERVPEDQLDWQPHPTSLTLGQLALHVAGTPGAIAELMQLDETGLPEFGNFPQPGSKAEILEAFEGSISQAKDGLASMDDAAAMAMLRVVHEGQEMMAMPKIGLARAIMLNHWYHHRGQMCVYLRMLGVPVPAVYGVSADENPFVQA